VPPYKRNLELTPRELRARMQRKIKRDNHHPVAVMQKLDKLMEQKKDLRSSNAKQKQLTRLWKELLMPLKAEIKNTVVMCNYEGGSEQRRDAMQGYLLVLNTLHDRLIVDSRKGFTPAQLGKAQYKPNNGNHWTDWIPPSVKRKVQELFEAIPRGGKQKIPFERKVPAALGKKLKARLLERTEKELDVAKRKENKSRLANDMDTNVIDMERIANIEQALVWIRQAQDNEALPTTWSGFY